jgi:uncharacterized protein YjbI with pentapeptide repeats
MYFQPDVREARMATLAELINLLHSPDNQKVLAALEELRQAGWLTDGTLNGNSLCNVHMESANLSEARLHKVDFHQARLQSADLSGVDLSNAKLTRAKLMGANLAGTNLAGADMYKVNLTGVKHLTSNQLAQAKRLFGAIMPTGGTYDGRYNLNGDLEFARWGNVDVNDPAAMAEFFGISLEDFLEGQKAADFEPI